MQWCSEELSVMHFSAFISMGFKILNKFQIRDMGHHYAPPVFWPMFYEAIIALKRSVLLAMAVLCRGISSQAGARRVGPAYSRSISNLEAPFRVPHIQGSIHVQILRQTSHA